MKMNSVKALFLLMIMGLVFYSCSEDSNVIEESSEEFRGGPGNNGGNNNNDGDNHTKNVASINNQIVNEWTDLMLELERYAGGMRPNASARALAYIHLATYETAVPGMRDFVSNSERLEGLNISRQEVPRKVHWEIALNACYADVIDHFLINVPASLKTKITELEEEQEDKLSRNQSNNLVEDSKEWGAYVAEKVIEYSQTDDEAEKQILEPQPLSYEPPTGAGYWTYSADPERALYPYWESVRTFVIAPEETTTIPPLEYSTNQSSPYYAEMMEVYEENNDAKAEQGEQLWIAEFWSDDVEGLMMSPPARQFSIANQLIDKYNLNLERTLVMMLKLGFSLNDAAVSTWKYKAKLCE